MLMPFVPGALIATAALNVPGVPTNATGFTVTCTLPGRLPAVGLTLSQGVPLFVIGVAVKLVTLELELDRLIVCVAALVSPGGNMKLSEFRFADIALGAPFEFALRVTGIERLIVPESTLIKPTSTPEVGAPAPIEAVITTGVAPVCGVTVSHPVSEKAVTVTFAVPLAVESRTVWTGVVTPVSVLNVS
jgi:hypothetical protein